MFTPAGFMMILIPIILGVVLGGWLGLFIGVSGIVLRKRVNRLQRKYAFAYLQGLMYWHLPVSSKHNHLPKSYVREYVS